MNLEIKNSTLRRKTNKQTKIIKIKGKNQRKCIKQTEQREDRWEAPKDVWKKKKKTHLP